MLRVRYVRDINKEIGGIRELDKELFGFVVVGIKKKHWWVVKDNGFLAAYAALSINEEYGYAFLARVGVHQNYRGRGLQKRFIKAREKFALDQGINRVITYTAPHNVSSNNSLITSGYKTYNPGVEYVGEGWIYWIKPLG